MLASYLKSRLAAAYRQLSKSLAGLPAEDARRGTDARWRRYRFGTGLDGSIAGIVRHVGAWKHAAAAGLESDAFPDAEALAPEPDSWPALRDWLECGHARLAALLDPLGDADLLRTVVWEGQSMTLVELFTHVIEHDHYHAGQVNLLRQQWGHALDD